MPRYTVHVRGEWLAVPCQDSGLTVGWLGREAVRRYMKNKPDNGGFASADTVRFLVRRCKGLGLLDNEDLLELALEDNEFVEVGEWLGVEEGALTAARPGQASSSPQPRGGGVILFPYLPFRKRWACWWFALCRHLPHLWGSVVFTQPQEIGRIPSPL